MAGPISPRINNERVWLPRTKCVCVWSRPSSCFEAGTMDNLDGSWLHNCAIRLMFRQRVFVSRLSSLLVYLIYWVVIMFLLLFIVYSSHLSINYLLFTAKITMIGKQFVAIVRCVENILSWRWMNSRWEGRKRKNTFQRSINYQIVINIGGESFTVEQTDFSTRRLKFVIEWKKRN